MFFILSKILSFLLSPIFWIVISIVLYFIFKKKTWRRKLLIVSFIVLVVFSNQFLFYHVSGWWEGELQNPNTVKNYDGIILLGGFSSYKTEVERIRFHESADRLMQALQLYKMEKVKYFVFTGGSARIIVRGQKEGMFLKNYLSLMGIKNEDLLVEWNSRNTHENAIETKQILTERELQKGTFLLVTSAFHMKRALGCFKKVGIDVYPYSTDPLQSTLSPDFADCIMPSASVLAMWERLFREWVGYVMYRFKGYV